MTSTTIAVTGATGGIGGRVARRLAEAGVAQRLLVRDAARAPQLDGAQAVTASYADAASVRAALEGVETVLMVSLPESLDRVDAHRTFIDAAVAAGVQHIVYTSFVGAAPEATFLLARDHGATEEHLKSTGVGYTMLRDNLYADFTPGLAGEEGVIRGPGGDGRVAVVAMDDIADVATAVLRDPAAHRDRTYELSGPEALTFAQIADVLGQVQGRTVRYEVETMEQARASRAKYGAADWEVEAWISTYTAAARGELDTVTGDVEQVAGHPATPLREVLERNAS